MRWVLHTAIVASLVGSGDAGAQFGRPVAPMIGVGTRVRVEVVADTSRPQFAAVTQRLHGSVRAIAAETLYVALASTPGTVAIPRVAIQGVQMSLGRPSRRASMTEVGGSSAMLFGLFLPAFVPRSDRRLGRSWRGMAASAGIGLAAGALLGALRPYERWRTAWIPE